MARTAIPVDLFNPGQVFACLGLMDAAEILLGNAEGGFDWTDPNDVRFAVDATGDDDPVVIVLRFLASAKVSSLVPAGSGLTTEKWEIPTKRLGHAAPFPFPAPASSATLPVELSVAGKPPLRIDHWGDETRRDKVKFWAGMSGYPGAALARDALDLVRDRIRDAAADPFNLSAPQSSSFRFDWRRDYIPLDIGFSPNVHRSLTMTGFPLVEILAAVGLSSARPQRIDRLHYRYGVAASDEVDGLLPPPLLRAALGCAELPFRQRRFSMRLGWPGKEGQARCISDVIEETPS